MGVGYARDKLVPCGCGGKGGERETESHSGFVLPAAAPAHHSTVITGP